MKQPEVGASLPKWHNSQYKADDDYGKGRKGQEEEGDEGGFRAPLHVYDSTAKVLGQAHGEARPKMSRWAIINASGELGRLLVYQEETKRNTMQGRSLAIKVGREVTRNKMKTGKTGKRRENQKYAVTG